MNLKKIIHFSFIFIIFCENIFQPYRKNLIAESKSSAIIRAMCEIIIELYVKNQIQFDVIIIRETSEQSSNIQNEFLAAFTTIRPQE